MLFHQKKRRMKRYQIKEGRENMSKFFMAVRKKRSAAPSFDTSSVPATSTENPLSNDVTPPSSTSAISVDCTEQKSIPVASTPTNQKPTPKQDELNVAVGVEKDILLLHHKKCNPGLLTQEDRKELKSCEKK